MVEELAAFSASSAAEEEFLQYPVVVLNPESNHSVCKRMRFFSESNQQEGGETSPLGLTLRKTPSFVNLVEMKLSQARGTRSSSSTNDTHSVRDGCQANMDDFVLSQSQSQSQSQPQPQPQSQSQSQPQQPQPMSEKEKLKASNFPASLLKIGSWERISKHEGDLIAKCYYAKKKIVWEVLEGALKSKIEIQWSEIEAIRAIIIRDDDDNEPGILEIELKQPPQFFRETNPQPRKHTLWQQASDFTGGQAPICRRHYVKFPPGTLDKHYEKLLQCDNRLFELSQKPFPRLESPYFYSNNIIYGDNTDIISFDFSACHCQSRVPPPTPRLLHYSSFSPPTTTTTTTTTTIPSSSSFLPPHPVHNNLLKLTTPQAIGIIVGSNSPMSVMDFPPRDETVNNFTFKNQRAMHWGQERNNVENMYVIKGLRPSITPATQANAAFSCQGYRVPAFGGSAVRPDPDTGILGDIENHLLSDSLVVCPDERMLLSRVKSMCSLLEPVVEQANLVHNVGTNHFEFEQEKISNDNSILGTTDHFKVDGGLVYQQQPIHCLPPPGVSDENRMDNYHQYAFPDPKGYDRYAAVDAGHEVRQWT